ncbi:hypothetical protein CAEBREN_28275 [Caenorhabditis brenneri]|uniref:Uncharacterized protein n=1 Tax=Caenorhabditis brenneri TaxID=135651 RepID=G0NMU0_CAEBE|nr:hypothetical protein CAEBREN_28275 [Caenorhabditis brenneri]
MFYLGLLVCILVSGVVWFHNRNSKKEFTDYFTQAIPVLLTFGILMIFVQAHNFIIALLSIQRFLLFFFRDIEDYLKYSEEKSNKVFYGIYIFFYLVHILILGFYSYQIEVGKLDDWPVRVYLCFYVFVNLVLFASAILYIPIMMRIRKLARLSITNQNRQQRYILYQTISIVIFKMSHAWIVFLVELGSFPLYMYITVFLVFDLFSTPVLIQVSYLLCNRQNVEILRKKLYFDKFRSNRSRSSQVEPMPQRNDLVATSVV